MPDKSTDPKDSTSASRCAGCGQSLPSAADLRQHVVDAHAGGPAQAHSRSSNRRLNEALSDPKNIETAKTMTLSAAIEVLQPILRFKYTSNYTLFLIIALETYLVDRLDLLVNLGIRGPISSGKTTAARALKILGSRVEMTATVTPAAIPALAEVSHALIIDRIDRRLKARDGEQLAQLLDAGYERGLDYTKLVPDQETGRWFLGRYNVFGIRILTYVGRFAAIHPSTASRTPEVTMVPARSGAVRRGARRLERKLAPLTLWLKAEAEKALATYSYDAFEALEESAEFRAFSDGLDAQLRQEKEGEDRLAQLAENLWILAHVAGWDVERPLQEWLQNVREEEALVAKTGDPSGWSDGAEQKWRDLTVEGLRSYVITEIKLPFIDGEYVAPVGWCWRVPRVGVLAWIAKFGGLNEKQQQNIPARIKTTIIEEIRNLRLLSNDKVSPRHDKGDQRSAYVFDADRLRALHLRVRDEPPPGDGTRLLHPRSDLVRAGPLDTFTSKNYGPEAQRSAPVRTGPWSDPEPTDRKPGSAGPLSGPSVLSRERSRNRTGTDRLGQGADGKGTKRAPQGVPATPHAAVLQILDGDRPFFSGGGWDREVLTEIVAETHGIELVAVAAAVEALLAEGVVVPHGDGWAYRPKERAQ